MKVIKVDFSTPKGTRIESPNTYCRREHKVGKNQRIECRSSNNHLNLVKSESPIIFHNVHSNKITERIQLSEYQSLSDAFNEKFGKEVESSPSTDERLMHLCNTGNNPLRIKVDPKYQNASLNINKKFLRMADSRNRRITFIPSSPRGSSVPIFISDNLQSSSFNSKRATSNEKSATNLMCNIAAALPTRGLEGSSANGLTNTASNRCVHSKDFPSDLKKDVKKRLNSIENEEAVQIKLGPLYNHDEPSTIANTSSSLGKFNSDARVKLHKNKVQTFSNFSTATFRIKMKGREKHRI